MGSNYDQIPTFLGFSEGEIGVVAGGSLSGYAGVVLHEPTEELFRSFVSDVEDEGLYPKGAGLNYNSLATITISGLLKWTNSNLSRSPKGRQDVREAGPVRIELFDTDESRKYVEHNSRLFEYLGIQFIG